MKVTESAPPSRTTPRLSQRCRHGLSLAEVVVSTLLVGLLLGAALQSVGASARSTLSAAQQIESSALAQQLLDEIIVLPYEDPNQQPQFGLESGESGAAGVRTGLDDVDDYKGWVDAPPQDRRGIALPGYGGWKRVVTVEKVHPDDHQVMPDSSDDKGLRRVTVTVVAPDGHATTLQAYRGVHGGNLQRKGVDQKLVTWVGVTLESGGADPVTGGVSLINHATDR